MVVNLNGYSGHVFDQTDGLLVAVIADTDGRTLKRASEVLWYKRMKYQSLFTV